MHRRQSFELATRGRATYEITEQVQRAVRDSGVREGLCTVFVHHTSCSLIISENADPAVHRDLNTFLDHLVPDGDRMFTHVDEGPDDMPSHVKNVLTHTSLGIPVADGRCDLGTWQGIYLWEHRRAPHRRRVSVTVLGADA